MARGTTIQGATPRGTAPLATRRGTKSKRLEFGAQLIEAHAAKQARKAGRRALIAARAGAIDVVKDKRRARSSPAS